MTRTNGSSHGFELEEFFTLSSAAGDEYSDVESSYHEKANKGP